ncbi:MAG: zinc ribbon domain-containing protein [Bryobacterales bacterium]|nr:zinc ribbon domain-containing protein [Bryobacterales bacterium]
MPIFEYRCDDCGTKFEKLLRRSAESSGVECPSCASGHLTQQLSTFAAHANGPSAQPAMGSCPSGMCRTPGLCGRN